MITKAADDVKEIAKRMKQLADERNVRIQGKAEEVETIPYIVPATIPPMTEKELSDFSRSMGFSIPTLEDLEDPGF